MFQLLATKNQRPARDQTVDVVAVADSKRWDISSHTNGFEVVPKGLPIALNSIRQAIKQLKVYFGHINELFWLSS